MLTGQRDALGLTLCVTKVTSRHALFVLPPLICREMFGAFDAASDAGNRVNKHNNGWGINNNLTSKTFPFRENLCEK